MVKNTDKTGQIQVSAGLAIVCDGKLLLGRPTGCNKSACYSIPKGHVEKNETLIDAAIRETYEEVGLRVSKEQITNGPHTYKFKNGKKILHFFIVKIDNISDVGMRTSIVDESNLKPNKDGLLEIDWAGFLPIEEARLKASYSMQRLIDMVEKFIDGNYYFS